MRGLPKQILLSHADPHSGAAKQTLFTSYRIKLTQSPTYRTQPHPHDSPRHFRHLQPLSLLLPHTPPYGIPPVTHPSTPPPYIQPHQTTAHPHNTSNTPLPNIELTHKVKTRHPIATTQHRTLMRPVSPVSNDGASKRQHNPLPINNIDATGLTYARAPKTLFNYRTF